MQEVVNVLATWATRWNVSINKDKSSTTLFILTKQQACKLTLGDYPLKDDDGPTYLGVNFDKRQIWKPHLQEQS